ncbi:hypothetical protein CKAH01_12441 [Colletotrichum kahawae]|uniref:Uncharacterized protein n=1 Tax=Colletotrichum kahawae TaxID=34407 RepID=A0AAD9YUA0_COLKA|nr:hypothetical protein CKAH01_12441 [Colletotrichum kahawae]
MSEVGTVASPSARRPNADRVGSAVKVEPGGLAGEASNGRVSFFGRAIWLGQEGAVRAPFLQCCRRSTPDYETERRHGHNAFAEQSKSASFPPLLTIQGQGCAGSANVQQHMIHHPSKSLPSLSSSLSPPAGRCPLGLVFSGFPGPSRLCQDPKCAKYRTFLHLGPAPCTCKCAIMQALDCSRPPVKGGPIAPKAKAAALQFLNDGAFQQFQRV